MNSLNRKKWIASLDECDAHILRIQKAMDQLADKLPLTKEVYDFLDDREIAYIDQIVFRFSKLQDTVGKKIFPLGLVLLGEDVQSLSFIDLLNKLEALGMLPSPSKWMEWREMRNDLTHEYPDVVEDRIGALNTLKSVLAEMLGVYANIRKIVNEKIADRFKKTFVLVKIHPSKAGMPHRSRIVPKKPPLDPAFLFQHFRFSVFQLFLWPLRYPPPATHYCFSAQSAVHGFAES